jgi:hypothetical protein
LVQTARKWGYDWALEIRSFLFFISQYSLQSQNTFFYVYIIFVFYIIVFTLQKVNSIHILGGVLWQLFKSFVFVYIFKAFFFKVGTWIWALQTFWLDVRRNILLYYLQVGGYSAENFFEARSNFNEIMLLELFNQGIGLQVCINTSNFFHGATFFCICQLPWILEHDWIFIY